MRAAKFRHTIAWIGVGAAFWLGGLGMFISFAPGFETEWFGTAAGVALAGLLSPGWRLQIAGVALAAVFAWFAWLGHEQGLAYQEWLRKEQPRLERLRQRHAEPTGER